MVAPTISVIIPVYNADQTLSVCIESILAQEFDDWEVILIDDGSSDNSAQICKQYEAKDRRIHYFYKVNGGVSSARNLGLEKARGEWLTFIDSDDQIEPHYFDLPESSKSDFVLQQWRFSTRKNYEDILPVGIYSNTDYLDFMSKHAHRDIFRVVYAKFYKRDIIHQHQLRFDCKVRLGEDTLFVQEYTLYVKSLIVWNTSGYVYVRPDDWGDKYRITRAEFAYFFHVFYRTFQKLPYRNEEIFMFLYVFLANLLTDGYTRRNIWFLRTLPEYVAYRNSSSQLSGVKRIFKYSILRFASFFHFLFA